MYQPPDFDPVQFDDASVPTRGRSAVRWLSGWHGHVGDPAEQVILGWALDEKTAIVVATCTVTRLPDKAARRADAVFQAVGSDHLGPVSLTPRERQVAMDRARTVADFDPVELSAEGEVSTGGVSTVEGFLVGHTRVGVRVVSFGAVGLDIDQIKLCALESAEGYSLDPRTTLTTETIEAQQPTIFG